MAPRDAHRCQEQIETAYNQGPSITNDLKEAIKTLFSRMGGAGKVVLFHYPYIVADIPEFLTDKNRHFDATMGPLVIDAAHGVRNAVQFSNEAVSSAVENANTELEVDDFAMVYKDIPILFAGHEAHPGFLEVNKEGWIAEFNALIPPEMFHLNAEGHKQWAAAISKEDAFGLQFD